MQNKKVCWRCDGKLRVSVCKIRVESDGNEYEWSCVVKGHVAKDFYAMPDDLVSKVTFENEI